MIEERQQANLIVDLMRLALAAPDVPGAVTPILDAFVERTAAQGAAYLEHSGAAYRARATSGLMPRGPLMVKIARHGLPEDTPLLLALRDSASPLFIDDTGASQLTAGFPELGVAGLAAAPVRGTGGELLGAFLMHTFSPHRWTAREARFFADLAETLGRLAARLIAEEQARAAREGALRALGLALDYRDGETKGHTDRVTELAVRTGQQLGLSPARIDALRWGAYLHDIGKIALPDAVLGKTGRPDDAEWRLIWNHPVAGRCFASELGFLPSAALDVILHHHEHWDGSGYPEGRRGEEIPLPARIFAVCDVYDALTSPRPYKLAWTHQAAIAEIREQAGRQFDPEVVDAFLRLDLGRS